MPETVENTETIEDIENALTIGAPSSDSLVLDDYRRLTGPGLLWERPGAVLDVFFTGFDTSEVLRLWEEHARRALDGVGWTGETVTFRSFDGGVNLAISAPMDQLYSAIFVAQTAWHFCAADLLSEPAGDFSQMIGDVRDVMVREANPALITLIKAAEEHGVDVLCDDDELSLGHGTGSMTWPVSALPEPNDVSWDRLHNVPVALITGTNGKTTTTRLLSAIASAAGKVSGLTSTDFVRVGDEVLDKGDYSGPGGARMLLRDQRLEFACLEVARGGILRRGLPLRRARAALVANVAADHLGQYGVNTVPDLAAAKFAVYRTLADDGILVLNADDEFVVAEAARTSAMICWFSLDPEIKQIRMAREAGQPCAWLEGTTLRTFDGKEISDVIDVADIPITMGGAARYNVQNALGALCLARAMGVRDEAICTGLSRFQNDPKDNPGRCNEFDVNGARVFVDFAHNPHSIAAVVEAMTAIPSKRRFILLSHGGDRSDQDIRDVTRTALGLKPDVVVAAELADYLRGRELGEVSALIGDECRVQGLAAEQVINAPSALDGVKKILNLVESGDLALLLVLADRDEVFELLDVD